MDSFYHIFPDTVRVEIELSFHPSQVVLWIVPSNHWEKINPSRKGTLGKVTTRQSHVGDGVGGVRFISSYSNKILKFENEFKLNGL